MTKQRKFSIITLAVLLIATFIAAVVLFTGTTFANAERKIILNGSNYFYTANGAQVADYATEGETADYYVSFLFADDDSAVTYRKNLAFDWYSADGEDGTAATKKYLNTEIGFGALDFMTFTIKFQSQQYTKTKDGVTDNYITFVADAEKNCVYAVIGEKFEFEDADDFAAQVTELAKTAKALSYNKLSIAFTNYSNGEYSVSVSDGSATENGTFKNMANGYSKYVSSSSSTSVIPVTYSAQFAENHQNAAQMVLYSFNGQSFKLSGSEGSRMVTDDTPPVLCISGDVASLKYGYALDIDYAVVDMLATSPKSTLNYYVLQNSQVNGDKDLNATDNGYYTEVTSSDPSPIIRGNDAYEVAVSDGTGYTTECFVKIYFDIKDSTATGYTSDIVYLDWYVPSANLQTVKSVNFIKAVKDTQGASYKGTVDDIQTGYQALVDAALAKQEVSAGDGNYFYLPSFEGYIQDNLTPYSEMTFSVYYLSSTSGSKTSLAYNQLEIEVEEDGLYVFAIYATDADGNAMFYTDNGKNVKFEASELADLLSNPVKSDLSGFVPVFSFNVDYTGLSVEDPEGQDIGYTGTKYTASEFDITGLKSNYTTSYKLYLFDMQKYAEDNGSGLTYSQLVKKVNELYANTQLRVKYFKIIKALDDMSETDAAYDLYADYEWDPDTRSFIPQDDNSFYVIVLEATDNEFNTAPVTSCMAISVSAAPDPLKGENDWLSKNIVAVVLFVVAGLAFIGIILLVFIKPKEKGDIDVIDENDSKKKSRKKVNK